MKRPIAFASLVAALALGPALAGDTKDGNGWKFTKGEKARYAYVYDLSQDFQMVGMPMPPQKVSQKARLELTEETLDATDDAATIQATIDRVQIELEMPSVPGMMQGGTTKYDSAAAKTEEPKKDKKDKKKSDDDDDDDDGPGMGGGSKPKLDGLGAAVGGKFTFKMARDGSISDVKGLDAIAAKVKEKLGGGAGEFGLLDPEVIRETLDIHCHVFGNGGDSWEIPTTIRIPRLGTLEFKRTITPKNGDGDLKLAEAASKPAFKPDSNAGAANPMAGMLGKPKVKDTGFGGSSTYSRDKGKVVGDELTATMTSEYSMNNPMAPPSKGGDDDDDDDAPKKKDAKKADKKDDSKKSDSKKDKKSDDDDDDDDGGKGGGMGAGKIQLTQNFKLVLKYELLTGDAPAAPAPAPEKKEPEKKDKSF